MELMHPYLLTEVSSTNASMLEAANSMFSSTKSFLSLAASLMSLVVKVETQTKALAEKEGALKEKERLIEYQRQELALKLVKLDEKETRLANREKKQRETEDAWLELEQRRAESASQAPILVNMSVGGKHFTTRKSVLLKCKGSYFEHMLATENPVLLETGEYFVDRNPKNFHLILEFLQGGCIDNVQPELKTELEQEFRFFNIPYELRAEQDIVSQFNTELVRSEIHMFNGGSLVSPTSQDTIRSWLPACGFSLLYMASRDGFLAKDFHKKCDGKGATLAIIQSTEGYLFGGFSSHPWDSTGTWASHPKSFIFTLTNPFATSPTKFPLKPTKKSILCHSGYCAVFGNDIHLFSDSNKNNHSYFNFPVNYSDCAGGKGYATFTGTQSFTTLEIEVYSVTNL